ncbi:MAG: PilZ domain-containing protein [Candidatus Alcyoniella australis]|nr:PilZ domain-containing protein [Candidatus Alcyoniella australis]
MTSHAFTTENDLSPKKGKQSSSLSKESRKATRRKTRAVVRVLDGSLNDSSAVALNVSLIGAYISTDNPPPVGSRLSLQMSLPSEPNKPIRIGGRIVRMDRDGVGLLFEDINARDQSRIRKYAHFFDLDDAVVALQGALPGVISGNLLPINDKRLIAERLKNASERDVQVLVALSSTPSTVIDARLDMSEDFLQLHNLDRPLPENASAIYCALLDGPLHAVFEGVVAEHGAQPRLMYPDRIYHNDRRCSRRLTAAASWLSIQAPHYGEGSIRLEVVDISEGGCAVLMSKSSMVAVGMRFPEVELCDANQSIRHEGATVTRISNSEFEDRWLIGLNFLDMPTGRDAFANIQNRTVKSSLLSTVRRLVGVTRKKALDLFTSNRKAKRSQVYVCQYKNTRRERVAGILDATFDLNETPPPVDVVVLIAPPFQVRKEVFNLLSRTMIDNFRRDGINAVTLRFDMTHMIGESHSDPDPGGDAAYFYNWTYSTFESDMIGSLAYLQRRFQPAKRVMVSFSVAAIPARRMIADGEKPGVDLWVAPFGCPDGQDQFKFLTAGVDLFQQCLEGEHLEPIYLYGRRGDVNGVVRDAIDRKMGFLEDARNDMSKVEIPVSWILGTYDYVVTRERVRQMLNAPGGGLREIIELPSGHLLKTGPEAIESYKLISETVARHLFRSDRPAIEPDMTRFVRQNEAEWARVKRARIEDSVDFWDKHLFGPGEDVEGYDMFLHNPDYVAMMRDQAVLLDPLPGQRIIDLGCGTGNFTLALLDQLKTDGQPITITCTDLVPKAVERTREKVERMIAQNNGEFDNLTLDYRVVDLEAARLAPLRDFLSGKLYGPVALAGRIEGIEIPTLRKIAADYGPRLHEILHGAPSSIAEVLLLSPNLDETEVQIVLELSMASRFLKGDTLPEDLRPNCDNAEHTGDLALKQLSFGRVRKECQIDLPSESFDKIGCSIVLPYLYDPLSAAQEMYRILAPGGVIVLSSPKPNYDSSKSYVEEAQEIEQRTGIDAQERQRLIKSLADMAAFVSHVIELEDEGRFRFFTPENLCELMLQAGFVNISPSDALGDPPTAVVVRAEKG